MKNAQKIAAGEFKSKCLKLMDDVAHDHTELVVTKRGKPLVKIIPYQEPEKATRSAYGWMKGTITIPDDLDLTQPMDVEWEANA
jgi:prevent-host-death family protein